MNFKAFESAQKLAGSYYTPPATASFLARWILSGQPQTILEPSVGNGALLGALADELSQCRPIRTPHVAAIEIDKAICNALRRKIGSGVFSPLPIDVKAGDFLEYSRRAEAEGIQFDAVIGNPPFIRYQYLDQTYQGLTERIFRETGLAFTKHTNAWVPFVLQSLKLLRAGGKLGMVLPAEIVHVLHAQSLRQYLTETCEEIIAVDLEDLFSADVLQGVVLLLCTKAPKRRGGSKAARLCVSPASSEDIMNGHAAAFLSNLRFQDAALFTHKWMEALLTPEELRVLARARALPGIKRFKEVASVDVGIVTGANSFFLVNKETVEKFDLGEFARPMYGRSSHVKGVLLSEKDLATNAKDGLPAFFLDFPDVDVEDLPANARRYIELGEKDRLHTRFKCRIRDPWYCVPSVWPSRIGMLKRAHHVPRLILNEANALSTDTAYRIKMNPAYEANANALVSGFVNSLTCLSAELEGRHYGGGVLELVPSEIERLVVPIEAGTNSILETLDRDIRTARPIADIVARQDKAVLKPLGLSADDISILNSAWQRLMRRRQRAHQTVAA